MKLLNNLFWAGLAISAKNNQILKKAYMSINHVEMLSQLLKKEYSFSA